MPITTTITVTPQTTASGFFESPWSAAGTGYSAITTVGSVIGADVVNGAQLQIAGFSANPHLSPYPSGNQIIIAFRNFNFSNLFDSVTIGSTTLLSSDATFLWAAPNGQSGFDFSYTVFTWAVASNTLFTAGQNTELSFAFTPPTQIYPVGGEPRIIPATLRSPKVILGWSDNGGQTWSEDVEIEMGKTGEYFNRVNFWQCGEGRMRVWRVRFTEQTEWIINGASVIARGARD